MKIELPKYVGECKLMESFVIHLEKMPSKKHQENMEKEFGWKFQELENEMNQIKNKIEELKKTILDDFCEELKEWTFDYYKKDKLFHCAQCKDAFYEYLDNLKKKHGGKE